MLTQTRQANTTTRLISVSIGLLLSLVMCVTAQAQSDPLLNDQPASGQQNPAASPAANSVTNSAPALAAPDDEFLRVEEAYILSIDAQPQTLTLHWDMEPAYYLYRERFRVQAWDMAGEEIPLDPQYQKGKVKYDEYFEKDMEVFYNQTDVVAALPAGLEKIQLQVTSQGCADAGLCYPPYTERFEVDLTNNSATPIAAINAKPSSGGGGGNLSGGGGAASTPFLGYILLLAVLGGIILNAMPCVFPVLSIKALSFVSASGSDHNHHLHGWAYTLGTVVSFLVIGGVIVAIRLAGGDADWGRQLQSPLLVTLMVYLFLVMGLSLSGFVQFGTRLMGVGQSLTTRHGLQGSFFTGVLAVVVASPCTAPFMAPALGVALTQTPVVALMIFAALGFGMALPFLLLSYSPKLAALLPQPGAWMEVLKQFLAFPLYLTAVWLLWVMGRQTGVDAVAAVICGAIAIVFALWLYQKHPQSRIGQWALRLTGVAALAIALTLVFKAETIGQDDLWQDYSPELVADMRRQGHPVFINLTAAWCITCHANERVALGRDSVKEAAKNFNVVMVKGDYTNEDPAIHALLNEYNRPSVPLYLMFPADPGKPPEILPQILTQSTVIDAMERAADSGSLAAN